MELIDYARLASEQCQCGCTRRQHMSLGLGWRRGPCRWCGCDAFRKQVQLRLPFESPGQGTCGDPANPVV